MTTTKRKTARKAKVPAPVYHCDNLRAMPAKRSTFFFYSSLEQGRADLEHMRQARGCSLGELKGLLDLYDATMAKPDDPRDTLRMPGGIGRTSVETYDNDGCARGRGKFTGYIEVDDPCPDDLADILQCADWFATRGALEEHRRLHPVVPEVVSKDALRKRAARVAGKVKPRGARKSRPLNPMTPHREVAARRKAVDTRLAKVTPLREAAKLTPYAVDLFVKLSKAEESLRLAQVALATAERRAALVK